jgi:hypothetical protein
MELIVPQMELSFFQMNIIFLKKTRPAGGIILPSDEYKFS